MRSLQSSRRSLSRSTRVTGEIEFAVDTSFVIALLKGKAVSPHSLTQIGFPVPVVGELRYGVLGGVDPARRLAELERLITSAIVVPSDAGTAIAYADLRHRLKTAGTPLPENDIWIAATCLQHGLMLLTLDRHFDKVEGLRIAAA